MHILKSKKGSGLPIVLAIVAFVLGTTATLLSYVFFQAKLSDLQIQESEDYKNAVSKVNTAIHMIARDQNLDPLYLAELELLLDVDISTYGTSLYVIRSNQEVGNRKVVSYLTGTVTSVNTYESIFQYTGAESNFNLSPLVTPTNLASNYLPQYIGQNFTWFEPQTKFTDFQSVITYIRSLALEHKGFNYQKPKDLQTQWDPTAWWHWYVDGSVTIPKDKNLTVPDSRTLVIDGNLTMNANSTIYGNVIVNGNVILQGNKKTTQGIVGTLYVNGNFTSNFPTTLGTVDRPSFVFAEGDVFLGSTTSGYGYFLSTNFNQEGNLSLTGGIYAVFSPDLSTSVIVNPNLEYTEFYDYGIPQEISLEPSGDGETTPGFVFTTPKLA
jgi:hypothetical protein